MADLGNLLDEELQEQALAILGEAGDYTTHIVQDVAIDTVYNLDRLQKDNLLPFVVILDIEGDTAPGAHNGSGINLELVRQYSLVMVDKVTGKREAQVAAKVIVKRLLNFICNETLQAALYTLAGDDGEHMTDMQFGKFGSQLVTGRADKDDGDYIVVAGVNFSIETSTAG